MDMKRLALLCAFFSLAAALFVFEQRSTTIEAKSFPSVINLPNGWLPEGVAVGNGGVIYAGSRRHGAIYAADLKTGDGQVLVPPQVGRIARGLPSTTAATTSSSRAALEAPAMYTTPSAGPRWRHINS
jgi:hypothetical protein